MSKSDSELVKNEPSSKELDFEIDGDNLQAKKIAIAPQKVTLYVLLVCIGLFIFYVLADRVIPSTDMARVRGNVVPLTPLVSGEITAVHVKPNDVVGIGEPLIEIDQSDYRIAVKKAEQGLEIAGKQIGVQTASIKAAQAQLSDAIANQENTRRQANRVLSMVEKGIVTQSDADKTRATLAQARAQVEKAKAGLVQAKKQLGRDGEQNTEMQTAILALQKAQLDLERTTIRAPSSGGVSNFRLDEGIYANKGQPIMTFVSGEDRWVEAYYRENSLGNIKAGDTVEIALDNVPGEIFTGQVASIDFGVNWGQGHQSGELASVENQTGWLRQSQRFPVVIRFDGKSPDGALRVGGQADVMLYTQETSIMNMFGKLWIRVISWLSYIR
ncbi:HlyD family secretion protein [Photobacterium minamisatsumaniensis]|uniref:HlyD family secretion protein n=1 Tax=Photobacterium minamisatsumaniensis TaxID=2910233 RepID=UPI003D0AA045